jgi:hypothetical protein
MRHPGAITLTRNARPAMLTVPPVLENVTKEQLGTVLKWTLPIRELPEVAAPIG